MCHRCRYSDSNGTFIPITAAGGGRRAAPRIAGTRRGVRQMANYRYGASDDGPDPLTPPYDVREALDDMGERILAGDNPRDALRDLLRRGWQDRRGLGDLMRPGGERARGPGKAG